MEQPRAIRRFGYYEYKPGGTIDFAVNAAVLTDEVFDEFNEMTSVVTQLQPIIFALTVAERNYESLVASIHDVNQSLHGADFKLLGSTRQASRGFVIATQVITNFLASASAFLNQTETHLGRVLGKDSAEWRSWNEQRKSEHASNFSYRFLYELRNFSQHFSLPISNFGISGNQPTAESTMSVVSGAKMSRDHLLQSGYEWRALRGEIATQPSEFELKTMLDEYMHILRRICLNSINIFHVRLAECSHYLFMLKSKLQIPEGATFAIFLGESEHPQQPPARHLLVPTDMLADIFLELDKLLIACS